MPQPCTAVSELCHFCSSIDLCHLRFTCQVKLKSQKPCTPVFSSTVISAIGWQPQDVNLNRNSWNYAFQKGSAALKSHSKKWSPVIIERGKKGVLGEQSSLTLGRKEKKEWWVFIRGLCKVPSHGNFFKQHHGCSQCSFEKATPLSNSSVWRGLSPTTCLPEAIISLMNHSSNLETRSFRDARGLLHSSIGLSFDSFYINYFIFSIIPLFSIIFKATFSTY